MGKLFCSFSLGRTAGKMQNLWEVNVETKVGEARLTDRQISFFVVHSSYHPKKPNLVLSDSYGGEFGKTAWC